MTLWLSRPLLKTKLTSTLKRYTLYTMPINYNTVCNWSVSSVKLLVPIMDIFRLLCYVHTSKQYVCNLFCVVSKMQERIMNRSSEQTAEEQVAEAVFIQVCLHPCSFVYADVSLPFFSQTPSPSLSNQSV